MRPHLASRPGRARRAAALLSALAAGALAAAAPLRADEPIVVTSCPGQQRIAVTFRLDCSHVRDPAARAQCRPFIENQACKVFPAYRRITGIDLEKACPEITYTVYDKDQWPHPQGGEGGQAGRCSAELLSQFSVLIDSAVGPYDVHELLHIYQSQIGSLPYSHILFGPSQLEARREIGDRYGYEAGFARLKKEVFDPNLEQQFARMKPELRCPMAEVNEEARLYISDPKAVYAYYRELEIGWQKDQAQREARFNRMFAKVSEGRAKKFLLEHGCAPW
ncbi:MAG: hypothetical protein KGJ68_05955 [Gammaproteobacteria bacterium]|nr:hypothetical protein [Gammaproteobacteria bacterium]